MSSGLRVSRNFFLLFGAIVLSLVLCLSILDQEPQTKTRGPKPEQLEIRGPLSENRRLKSEIVRLRHRLAKSERAFRYLNMEHSRCVQSSVRKDNEEGPTSHDKANAAREVRLQALQQTADEMGLWDGDTALLVGLFASIEQTSPQDEEALWTIVSELRDEKRVAFEQFMDEMRVVLEAKNRKGDYYDAEEHWNSRTQSRSPRESRGVRYWFSEEFDGETRIFGVTSTDCPQIPRYEKQTEEAVNSAMVTLGTLLEGPSVGDER